MLDLVLLLVRPGLFTVKDATSVIAYSCCHLNPTFPHESTNYWLSDRLPENGQEFDC